MRARANNARSRRTTLRGAARAVAVALLAIAPSAHALHCGTRVIDRGDANGRVYRGFTEEVVVEEWTYNFGPYQLMVKIRLDNGIVADIKYLGYGY